MFENLFINAKIKSDGLPQWFAQTKKMNQSLSNINKDANRTAEGLGKLGKSFKGLNQVIGVGKLVMFATQMAKSIQSSLDMIETTNLFNVALGDTAIATDNVVQKMSKLYGLDATNLQNSVGTYALLARSMGMTTQQASVLSTNVSNLAVDLASLTNVPINQTMADLRSGLLGQSETVYKYGMDVTEAGIKTEALRQGISKSVREMTQGEKMALRYSVMIRQSGLAQGDFARTIDAPANQLKILGERFITLGRSIGSIFVPMLSAVLPYLNAFVMILIDLANLVAKFFGFKPPKVENTYGSAIGGIGDEAEDTAKGMDKATKSAKKFKNSLMGIDEINILPKQEDPSGGGGKGAGGGGGGSILPDFKLPEYDSGMDKIKSKADEIKDYLVQTFKDSAYIFDPLIEAFGRFKDALAPLKQQFIDALGWVWDNILVPYAKWGISSFLPAFLDVLSGALNVLTATIDALKPLAQWLWDNLLLPLAQFTGGIIIDTLVAIASGLNDLATWIRENQNLITELTDYLTAFKDELTPLATWITDELVPTLLVGVEVIKEIVTGLIDSLSVVFQDLMEVVAPIIDTFSLYALDIFQKLVKDVLEQAGLLFKAIKEVFDKLWKDAIKPALEITKTIVLDTLKIIRDNFYEYKDKISSGITEHIEEIKRLFLKLWKEYLEPIVKSLLTTISWLWDKHLKGVVDEVLDFVGTVTDAAIQIYNKFILPLIEWFMDYFGPVISETIKVAIEMFGSLVGAIADIIKAIIKILGGIIDFIAGIFTGDWERAWKGIVKIFVGIWDGLVGVFKGIINLLIDALNSLFRGLNKMNIKMPDWLGGKSFGFNLQPIPKLARGGMLEKGSLFQAGEAGAELIGSYNNQTTVMPLENSGFVDAMYKAVFNAVASATQSGGNDGDFVMNVDGIELARVTLTGMNKISKQEGRLALNI